MQILIIEDEPRAANQLQKLLLECNFDFELLGIIDTVEETIDWLSSHSDPDLIFMDIQLADGLSFEIFQHIEVSVPIVFTTAFDQYAIQAFKVNSIDYLLKPIKPDELEQAMAKFKRTNMQNRVEKNVLKKLLEQMQAPQFREGVLVKDGAGFIQLKINDLLYVYSEDSVTFGVSKVKRYVINETLDQLYSTLDKGQFYKINRGQIVSKQAIIKMEPYLNHRFKITLQNPRDQEFIVSRQRAGDFKEWINQ